MPGLLLLNKEKGISSFKLVQRVRRKTGEKKVGHAGTLDPLASGLMILLVGKAYTKKADSFSNLDKEYLAEVFIGKSTTTYDQEGETTFSSEKVPSLEEIKNALENFQGKVLQTPPMFSAKKVQGKKLYELARKGITVERKAAPVEMTCELISYAYPLLTLNVSCSKGTYIRSIAEDLGKVLTTGAHLYNLIRTRVGPFHVKDAMVLTDDVDLPIERFIVEDPF